MDDRVALILSGGVSLAAYQAGAFALLSRSLCPNWLAASSAGAINAALICGNAPERRLEALSRFWMVKGEATEDPLAGEIGNNLSGAWAWSSAMQTKLFGSPGFFRPNLYNLLRSPPTLYDLAPMQSRIRELVDFERLNRGEPRLTVATTDLETSETVLFDTAKGDRIEMPHLMASCGLLPEFAPVVIGDKLLGDGGLSANAPVEAVLSNAGAARICFIVDLFARDGSRPDDLQSSLARRQEIMFANQTYQQIKSWLRLPHSEKTQQKTASPIVFYLSYRPLPGEAGPEKQFDFSQRTLQARWRSGILDMEAALSSLHANPHEGGLRTIRRPVT